MHAKPTPSPIGTRHFAPGALCLLLLAASPLAFAQEATPPPAPPPSTSTTTTTTTPTTAPGGTDSSGQPVMLSEFTVQGSYAGSLEMAAEEKQAAPGIVEVIAPEDIGKLPDVSIADSLARLPGLTSQRVNGRFQDATIRGLPGDFNVGTLDGVEQATTGGDAGNDSRAVEYDQYPSELVGGVEVYKTGQADLIGGLGGTIDLQTLSPLSIDHMVVALSAFYNWTGYEQLTPGVKKAGESYTASFVDQFAKGTEGIFVGFAHTENPYEGKQFQAWGYPDAPDGNLILGGMRIYDQSELLTRDSAIMVLESKPFPGIHNKLDVFLSYYHDDQELRGMEVPMAEWGNPTLQPGYTVTDGLITKYTLTSVNPVIRNMDTLWTAHLRSFIDNLDIAEDSSWPVKISGGWSSAEKREEVLETYAGLGFDNTETDGSTWNVSQPAGPNPPQVTTTTDWSNASLFTLTDPQGWGTGTFPTTGQEGYLKYFQSYDVADSIKVMTRHELDLSILKDVEVGGIYSQRYKQFGQNPSDYVVNSNGQATAALPPLIGTTDLSWIGDIHPIAYDANAALNSGRYTLLPNPNPGTWEGDNYKVWEDLVRPYVMLDLKGNLGPVPFTGNIGIMGDFAKQNSTGLSGNGNIVTPVSGGANYAEALPALNLTFKVTPQDFVRFFIGREEMRPDMYYMRASRDYSYNSSDALSTINSPWGASSGNPELKPWLSNSVDFDLEHYFAKGGGYVSLAFFEKQLINYVYQQNTVESFAGYPYTGTTAPTLNYGIASQYVNGQGGNITGMEGTLEITSEALTGGAVRGFGINVNGILVDSSIKPFGPTGPTDPLPDMSKKAATLTFYFERWGFSARVSDHYQGVTREYIVQFGAPTFNSLGSANDGYSDEIPFHTIDAQVSYSFKKGALRGLTVYIEGRNLNNAPEITYNNGDPRQLSNWQEYGASYRTGVSYKF